MKIAINGCYGGFSLSVAAMDYLEKELNKTIPKKEYGYVDNSTFGIDCNDDMAYRSHPKLIEVIELLGGDEASGSCASLVIEEYRIPTISSLITEHDGNESLAYS